MYDVIIAGGSIAGLLCAREIALNGHSVLVLEEDYEIGTPEHCGGLVSMTALDDLGIIPHRKTFDHLIDTAKIHFPNNKTITINSKKQRVAEINRRELDKQIALQAQKNGADIRVKTSVKEFSKDGVRTNDGFEECKVIVDARGVSSLIQKDRTGILSSAQYEVYAEWIDKSTVEVYFDKEKYPGFFAWIIPSSNGTGKVGVAGKGINAAMVLEEFLSSKGKYSVIRKIFAPIWIKGPIEKFVNQNIVTIGDAAGQSKPTTAGGIFSCGMGGIMAGRAISKFLETNDFAELEKYPKEWKNKFGKEFEKQSFARNILERLENDTINKLSDSVTEDMIKDISEKDDFDFHTSSIVKLLGLKGSLKTAQALFGNEIKKLLASN
ncbi:dehydrogenase [Nitrosopumilus sp. b1]|uniref:NAD(P)/FAD-dependent oxidoreductase n=1 Tax=Nitrosopumilus sp. b1 TaxID=2109907 RepID=UPI0015F60663|nr:NAD(P)/FAD-dependent oxidoreductase [Nitrosopumilus sp. b1]KAF6243671.1 dehydrogenase [Nitrosopumilus sp. b1]